MSLHFVNGLVTVFFAVAKILAGDYLAFSVDVFAKTGKSEIIESYLFEMPCQQFRSRAKCIN